MAKISLDLDALRQEANELGQFLARPDAFSDPTYTKKIKRSNELQEIIGLVTRQTTVKKHLEEATALASGEDELAQLAKQEMPQLENELQQLDDRLFELLTPKDPNDEKDVIVEIRAGAGGD